MASLGVDVQSTSNELVSLIEDMKERRTELDRVIKKEEDERLKLLATIKGLQDQLAVVEDSLSKKHAARTEFDRTISETSQAFAKILDSSRLLLSSVKQESLLLSQK